MNKTDRMLAIVLELQARGRQRAEDLAATFETSKRTIYRDIQALGEAGVPLVSTPGHGYTLMKGYFLPPLSFTTEEASMLLLGSDYMAHSFDAQYREAAYAASRKIAGVLPERLRDDVRYLQENIRLVAHENLHEQDLLQKLRRAILDHTTIRFHYYARYSRDQQTSFSEREADPYALVHFPRAWHLLAYCHMRQDLRNFRLERIENLEVLDRTFQRSPDFRVQEHQPGEQPRTLHVRALFALSIARWVRETLPYFTTTTEDTPEGLLVTLQARQEEDILNWLLGWGRHVQVLEPESLRTHVRQEAQAILQNHS